MKELKSLRKLALIPVYNEEQKIRETLLACEKLIDIFIIVDDGSIDQSINIIETWKQNKENVFVIRSNRNKGMSWAVKRGFRFIQENRDQLSIGDEDIIIQIDADAQHSIDNIDVLISYMEKWNIDYLITKRNLKGYPLIKIIGNRLMSAFASLLTFRHFKDIECGYRLLKVKVVNHLLLYTVGFKYSWAQEMAVVCSRLGFKIDNEWETETKYYRKRGTKLKDALINCFFSSIMLHLKFFFKFSCLPIEKK